MLWYVQVWLPGESFEFLLGSTAITYPISAEYDNFIQEQSKSSLLSHRCVRQGQQTSNWDLVTFRPKGNDWRTSKPAWTWAQTSYLNGLWFDASFQILWDTRNIWGNSKIAGYNQPIWPSKPISISLTLNLEEAKFPQKNRHAPSTGIVIATLL